MCLPGKGEACGSWSRKRLRDVGSEVRGWMRAWGKWGRGSFVRGMETGIAKLGWGKEKGVGDR